MKKTLLLLVAGAALGCSILAMNAGNVRTGNTDETPVPTVMGFLINDDTRPVGWYTFSADDATSPACIRETAAVSAGAMAAGTYYAQTYTPGPVPAAWNTVDVATGEMTQLAECGDESPLYVDMTYDYSENKLWAIYHYGGMSTALCEVDRSNGQPTVYAQAESLWLATLACTYDGTLYALGNDGYLYDFDKAAKHFNRIGFTEWDIEYMQSMEFDHNTETLYWAASTTYGGYWYTIDTATGEGSYVCALGSEGEMTGLYIPFSLAAPEAPAAVEDLSISNPAHDNQAVVSLRLPSAKVNGEALVGISSVTLEADGEPVKTWTAEDGISLQPGSEISLQAETSEGLHAFKVYAANEAGRGLPASFKAFIGEDLPSVPSGIRTETDGLGCTVSWDATTDGAQGGYIDPAAVTYNVVRQPGNVEVASGTSALSCTDRVDRMGVYTYEVTAQTGKGTSATGTSAPTVVGDELTLPYTCTFEDENELLMWTIVDGNEDGVSWTRGNTYNSERTMLMRGASNRAVDEWLITPPARLEAGKSYKIVYDAGCMNPYYPAAYSVTLGRQATADGQSTVVESLTADRMNLNRNYVYLPDIEETGVYYIGFHAEWASGLATLYVSNVTIEENQAARLSGTVTDGEQPIEGATVAFGPEATAYTTDDDGRFKVVEIEAGEYPVSISKFGYETFSQTLAFAPLEHKVLSFPLTAIPKAAVSGRVTDTEGHGIENASVCIHGYDTYTTVTDKDGYFSQPGIYCKGDYTVDVHALNYESASATVEDFQADADMGTFALAVKLIAPGEAKAEATKEQSVVTWTAPEDKPATFRYDDGTDNYVFSMELSDVSEYTAVGVVYDTPAVFTSMSWHVWDTAQYAETVDVIVFDLDENGQPTNRILYEENGLESENWEWHECVFRYPVIAPHGALFTLRGDARLCMDSGGEQPDYPTMYDKMVFTHDYRTEAFTSRLADGTRVFRGNLLLRAAGLPYGAPRTNARTAVRETASAPSCKYDVWRLAEGNEQDAATWTKLTSEPVEETAYTDPQWETAEKGMYRYAVKAVYSDGEVSYPTLSNAVPRLLTSAVSLAFSTNAPGEDAAGANVLLAGKDNTHSYTAETGEDGTAVFPTVWEGSYTLTCTKKGFRTLTEEIEISGGTDFEEAYTLTEETEMPFNLTVKETDDATSRLLTWNTLDGLFEDFEGHEDWAINSPGEIGWSYIDGDGSATYASPNYEFPHMYEPMAFIVMNPSQADPNMVEADFMNAHSGEKALVAWATNGGYVQNDDYIISPELDMKQDFVISFWTRCYYSRYVETLRVGYSTSGKEAGDFTWIGENITVDDEAWKQVVVNIPKEARYVAINYISNDKYYVAIDDIFIGASDQIPGTTALATGKNALRAAGKPVSYEVYLDNEKIGTTTATEYLLEHLTEGNHVAGVKACYASGTTETATVSFEVIATGMTGISRTAVSVYASDHTLVVDGAAAGTGIRVYRTDGSAAAQTVASGPTEHLQVPSGIYFVEVGLYKTKVVVR